MTGPRSTAIRLEAAALDVQMRANMQNLLLVPATEGKTVMLITHSVEEAHLPRLAHRGGDGNCRVTKPHPGARHERVPRLYLKTIT